MSVNQHQLNRIFALTGRPGYCKVAANQAVEACPASGYADDAQVYACHTKDAAFCSAVAAHENALMGQPVNPDVQSRLAKFAAFWGVESDVKAAQVVLDRAYTQLKPRDLADSDYALRNDQVRKYAAYDADSTVRSATAFCQNRHAYPLAWRKQAAQELLARAEAHGAVLPEYASQYLHKAAGYAVPSQDAITSAIVQRLNISASPETFKLAEALDALAGDPELRYNPELVSQMLDVMDLHDRQTKMAAHYGTRLALPEEICEWTIPAMEKVAAQSAHYVTLANGHEVDVTDLPHDALATLDLGGASCQKLAEVLPTLPLPDADLLVRMLPKAAGVTTTGTSQSSYGNAMGSPAVAAPASPAPTGATPALNASMTAMPNPATTAPTPGGMPGGPVMPSAPATANTSTI
jgi:hypothetical protein